MRWVLLSLAGLFRSRASLVAENVCLRQQLIVLQRKQLRPGLTDRDRLFWILMLRLFPEWREALLFVTPATVLRWHRRGWKAYWRWRSRSRKPRGRRRVPQEVRNLIRRMASENRLWGQKRIQAELAGLGYRVSARTVAKYMRGVRRGPPSPKWKAFLSTHAYEICACDFFCVQTLLFETLFVFFVIHHVRREVVHVHVTTHPTAEWTGRQIIEACGWDREPPRYLIHDRDYRYGGVFAQRLQALGITSIRTPFRSPQANAIAERWVRSVRAECLDHVLIVNERHLRRVLAEYAAYYNHWRPHRALGQSAPCKPEPPPTSANDNGNGVASRPVLGGLHHVYERAA